MKHNLSKAAQVQETALKAGAALTEVRHYSACPEVLVRTKQGVEVVVYLRPFDHLFVLSWVAPSGTRLALNPEAFFPWGSVNQHHFQKATQVAESFDDMLQAVIKVLQYAENDTLLVPRPVKEAA